MSEPADDEGGRIRPYQALIVDDEGRAVERPTLHTTSRFPRRDEAVVLLRADGSVSWYRVVDVHHREEDSEHFSEDRFTQLIVVLKKDAGAGASQGDRAILKEVATSTAAGADTAITVVHDFHAGAIDSRSPTLGLQKLVALVAHAGYEEQRTLLESWKFLAWQMRLQGRLWVLQTTGGQTPEELRALSRAAKRNGANALAHAEQLLGVSSPEPEIAEVIRLDDYRGASS